MGIEAARVGTGGLVCDRGSAHESAAPREPPDARYSGERDDARCRAEGGEWLGEEGLELFADPKDHIGGLNGLGIGGAERHFVR